MGYRSARSIYKNVFFDDTFLSFGEVLMDEFDHFQMEFGAETLQIWSTHEVSIS